MNDLRGLFRVLGLGLQLQPRMPWRLSRSPFAVSCWKIPTDFCGVQAITVATAGTATTLRLSEKGSERTFEVQQAVMKHVPVHMIFECCTLFRDDLESPL